jgi:hypothetical protein
MDAYLASGELSSASHFYLNFNFELLNGCKLKCPGCYVDKGSQASFSENDYINFKKLLTSLTTSLYLPFIAFVGPTDFLSADNFVTTLTDPKVIEIFSYFKRLSLQTTYLDIKNAPVVAEILKKHYSHMEIEFNIVIDPARIMDDGYLKIIERNKKQFIELTGFEDVRNFGIMNVYDYDETKIPELLRDYDFMHKRVGHLFETTIDYNFSFGRSPDITNAEFLSLSTRIKNLFDTSLAPERISSEKAQYLRFSFGKLTDSLIERQYNYRNGKLYYSPLLYERFVSFRDKFEVPLSDYTVSEVESFEMKVQLEQYMQAPQTKECEACPFLGSCVDRGILHLMDVFDTKECLVAKQALLSVNNMLPQSESRV